MVMERWIPKWGFLPPLRQAGELADWEDFVGRSLLRPEGKRGWMPSVDVIDRGDKLVVRAELPGMKEEDIDISVAGDKLIIKGEKETETEIEEADYFRSECTYGSFYRSILLPSAVDASKIEANLEDGVLEVTLPKSAEVKPKKIAVLARKKAVKASK